eukprot:CAMPEP_0205917480 /NCGR_PEP_ID=MMETSP1325-20131115/9193_1 /ASSEMBLY_ACC=CAM_ASM_000708 /TAXON_ID=236786 /ORGANISM="Florenciella sp., Strain RCC1007" /LENGTH=110 /DNA_ID=CAMNT_0053284907 /DNA_START=648 /DNA_END=977 /DNA_ORIENTATION=-
MLTNFGSGTTAVTALEAVPEHPGKPEMERLEKGACDPNPAVAVMASAMAQWLGAKASILSHSKAVLRSRYTRVEGIAVPSAAASSITRSTEAVSQKKSSERRLAGSAALP